MSKKNLEPSLVLILDHCLDRAVSTRNILSNSGINFRISIVTTEYELECCLRQTTPVAVLARSDAFDSSQTPQIIGPLANLSAALILIQDESDTGFMQAALKRRPCTVIHSDMSINLPEILTGLLDQQQRMVNSRRSEQHAEAIDDQFRHLFEQSREAIAYVHEGFHVDANPAYLESLGMDSVGQLSGHSILELMRGIDSDLRTVMREAEQQTAGSRVVGVMMKDANGAEFMGEVQLSPIHYRNERCIQVLLRPVDENTHMRHRLDDQREADALTGLLNRTTFLNKLTRYLNAPDQRTSANALLYLQPDNFDEYLDTLGHAGADQYLASFAGTIQRCLSEHDIACRISDHGFAVLLRRGNDEPLDQIAQAILEATAAHTARLESLEIKSRCSIGLVNIGPSMNSTDDLLRQARAACREALETGHCLVRYKPRLSMVALDATSRAGWRERLRFGLEHGHFYTLQHNVVNIENEDAGYIENRSYLREEQGDQPATEFMAAGEACKMGSELDHAIIPGLLDAIAQQGHDICHIVNISSESLLDEGFPHWLSQELERRQIPGERLLLQTSASSLAERKSQAGQVTEALRGLGCRISLADFDSASSHLGLLGPLGVSLVKLQSELSNGLIADETRRETVRSLVRTASAAGVEVMVDGIQDASHLATLWQSGIKLVEGEFLQQAAQVVGQ